MSRNSGLPNMTSPGSVVVVTDAGLETWLVFDHGIDLPAFAAYPLAGDAGGSGTAHRVLRALRRDRPVDRRSRAPRRSDVAGQPRLGGDAGSRPRHARRTHRSGGRRGRRCAPRMDERPTVPRRRSGRTTRRRVRDRFDDGCRHGCGLPLLPDLGDGRRPASTWSMHSRWGTSTRPSASPGPPRQPSCPS